MSGRNADKLLAAMVGVVLLFVIGCTPGSSGSSSDSTAGAGGSGLIADAPRPPPSDPIGGSGGGSLVGDPVNDPPSGSGDSPLLGDPGNGNDPPGNGSAASLPEPATGLLFLCAAGSAALARLRGRKRA